MKKIIYILALAALCVSCGMDVPDGCSVLEEAVSAFPDYTGVTVPCNIAPLNYALNNTGDRYLTVICAPDGSRIPISGRKVTMAVKKWHSLLGSAASGSLSYRTFVRRGGKWFELRPFEVQVAPEPVDEWVTYRFLAPSYEFHSYLSIDQRNLTNFYSRELYHNRFEYSRTKQQCINCHSFQNYHTDNWQMHIRLVEPGTIVVENGEGRKLDLKTGKTISGGFYPAWHPTENIIVYSNNLIRQFFFAQNRNRIEQQDSNSDLVLYDVEKNELSTVAQDSTLFETYPAWSPDGRMLYYSCACQPELMAMESEELGANYEAFKYDIYRRNFDPATRIFGEPELVMDAKGMDKSALFPRISPDGVHMLVAVGQFGSCHNYHRDSDLWMMNLADGSFDTMDIVNSDESDSYHNWSSNGRWIIFTSRRMDGVHTRIFVSYFDKDGHAHKPFALPQKDPEYYIKMFKSFSVPEPTVEPLHENIRQVRRIVRQDTVKAEFN